MVRPVEKGEGEAHKVTGPRGGAGPLLVNLGVLGLITDINLI